MGLSDRAGFARLCEVIGLALWGAFLPACAIAVVALVHVPAGDYLGAAIAVALCTVFWLPWWFIGPPRLALHWRRLREAPRK